MTHRFPSTVRVTFEKYTREHPTAGQVTGYHYVLSGRDGGYLGEAWCDGSKAEARAEAWNHLEQLGLVVDE